ncbi:c-type cytochrome [Anditalea andensis]|uniref:Cytochrome c domain-containing protein n=1 Tax=Anditalea andensis TaxID=1048983 RepID=A0A074L2Q5_9BACT|nr:cytochrome c [Anditalea andensis]KEO74113.1 hypothetical protein EL17_08190 [Anditalea andensis]
MIEKINGHLLLLCLLLVIISCNTPSDVENNNDYRIPEDSYETIYEDRSDWPDSFGWGRPASQKEIDSLSIAIKPDGTGLPQGSGTVAEGRTIYAGKCAACHGPNGVEGPEDVLIGTESLFQQDITIRKTIGNYWPYSTTIFDYIRRAMPFNAPGSLSDEEVYSLTAYLLFKNQIIDEGKVIGPESLPKIEMPAKKFFVKDDRTAGSNPTY